MSLYGKKIAHVWVGNIGINVRHSLAASDRFKEDDCPLDMSDESGFTIWYSEENKQDSSKSLNICGFLPEAAVCTISRMLPLAAMKIAPASLDGYNSKEELDLTEKNMFTTPILFGPYKGMTVADFLLNSFTTYELQKIQATLQANMETHRINVVLDAGITKAIELLDTRNKKELNRIVQLYSSEHITLYKGGWCKTAAFTGPLVALAKTDLIVNCRAETPIMLRITVRYCKGEASDFALTYPYSGGASLKTGCAALDLNTLQGHILAPMELCSQKFREEQYQLYL